MCVRYVSLHRPYVFLCNVFLGSVLNFTFVLLSKCLVVLFVGLNYILCLFVVLNRIEIQLFVGVNDLMRGGRLD